jgi:CubicO group peptidase (beta-lactamase class C family)
MSLDPASIADLRARAQQDIDDGFVPSCQFALALNGEVLVSETLGAPEDARFFIWSATKPVFASVIWQLIGEGALDPAMRVVDLWPEFGRHGKDKVTLEHLLLFTAGFPEAGCELDTVDDREARVRDMEAWTLDWEPGTAYGYHGVSAHFVMAELATRVTGADHRALLRERVLDPLGLDRLELGVPVDRQQGIPQLDRRGEPATAQELADALGLPEVPPALEQMLAAEAAGVAANPFVDVFALQQPRIVAAGVPGAGGVGDAASLALFYQALLHNPKGIWTPDVLTDVTTNVRNKFLAQPLGVVAMRTLGLEVQGDDATARFRTGSGQASPRTFGHGGAYGQIALADPESGLSFTYLTNGADRNPVRAARRTRELTAAAVACVSAAHA